MRAAIVGIVATASLSAAVPALAQVTEVASPAALAALGPVTSHVIDGNQGDTASYTLGPIHFTPGIPIQVQNGVALLQFFGPNEIGNAAFPLMIEGFDRQINGALTGQFQLIGFHFGRFNPGTVNQEIRITTTAGNYDFTYPMSSAFNLAPLTWAGFQTSGSEYITGFRFAGDNSVALSEVRLGNLNGVPEPASWAMLLAGFGLAGMVLRRRRRLPVVSA